MRRKFYRNKYGYVLEYRLRGELQPWHRLQYDTLTQAKKAWLGIKLISVLGY